MSAGKAAEELRGYLCEGRLQVLTEGSCFGPRHVKHALLNQSTNRPDASQRRAGGSDVCHPGIGHADAHTQTVIGSKRG